MNFVCDKCHRSFTSQRLFATHISQRHRDYALATCRDGTELCLRRFQGHFRCICSDNKTFDSVNGFQKHIYSGKQCPSIQTAKFYGEKFELNDGDDGNDHDETCDEELEPQQMMVSTAALTSDYSHVIENDWSAIKEAKRDYDHAVLHACGAMDWRSEEQTRLLTFIDSYFLRPISLTNPNENVERNALTHQDHLQSLHESTTTVTATPPKKRKIEPDIIMTCMEASLYSTLICGPYAKRLLNQQYEELNDGMAMFLNEDWSTFPQMRYACSRLLAGIILLDASTGKSVIVNSVEVFGRRRSLDAHRESFRVKKEAAATTSLPPETTRYRNVWPTSYSDVDGIKLVIGTKIFNALVTSSLRIDIDIKPEIGPVTSNFILNTYERSFATKIFVKKSAWESAQHIARCEHTNKISNYDVIFQLRQLRTRFHQRSTYFACRGFNEPTDDISTRPYTVFTLCEWDNGNNDSGYRVGSLLLQTIANNMITGRGVLRKDEVDLLVSKIPRGIDMEKYLNEIIALFTNDDSIMIINNTGLNHILQKVARSLAPQISKANESIAVTVKSIFSS